MRNFIFVLFVFTVFISCKGKHKAATAVNYTGLQQRCVKQLTDVIVHDIFSPPVAGRIYAYANLAFYEGIRYTNDKALSITEQLHGFNKMPSPEKTLEYNYQLVAVKAFYKTGTSLIFSKDSMRKAERNLLDSFRSSLPEQVYGNSVMLGDSIASTILKRAADDNYLITRGMPSYSVYKSEGKWEQTPPDYMDASEPNWFKIKPMLLDSSSQFKPAPPPPYSLDKKSVYYQELMELYNLSKTLTPQQDSIARYWDDNPLVTSHEGHLMYANKKTTPGGHWQGINGIICSQQKTDPVTTARAFALMSTAMLDGFIACWQEKFRSVTIRPITVIQRNFDPEWTSLLQTPPFPEYTSGHSTISAAAATVMTGILGDNIAFHDTTELEYLGLERSFSSVNQAAREVSDSRLYGGIHYRSALVNGMKHGEEIGNLYLSTIK